MDTKKIRLLIADDHKLFREGMIKILSEQNQFIIVGEAEDGKVLVEKYFTLKPDICLVDISMPKMTGIEALKRIKEKDNTIKALFLSMFTQPECFYAIIKAGGYGLVDKDITTYELLYAMKEIIRGNYYYKESITKVRMLEINCCMKNNNNRIMQEFATVNFEFGLLTNCERKIFELYGQGYITNDIAAELFITKGTVDFHRMNIMKKLNIDSLPKLISIAARLLVKKE